MHPNRIIANLADVENRIRVYQHRLDTEPLDEDCRTTLGIVLRAQRNRRKALLDLLAWDKELAEVAS